MPLPVAALIGAGSSALGAGINAFATGIQNRKSRKWSSNMYDRQYQDNLAQWHRQNAYNSPEAQMERYKAAGLNPVLPFLKGGGMASGNAGPIPKADIKQPQFNTPDLSGIQHAGTIAINSMYSLEKQKLELDNLKKQNTVLSQEALLKAAQAIDVTAGGQTKQFNLGQEMKLAQTSIDTRREVLRQITASTNFKEQETLQSKQLHPGNMEKQAVDIALGKIQGKVSGQQYKRLKREIQNMAKDGKLKDYEIKLNEMGFTKQDAAWMRVVTTWAQRMLSKLGISLPSYKQ